MPSEQAAEHLPLFDLVAKIEGAQGAKRLLAQIEVDAERFTEPQPGVLHRKSIAMALNMLLFADLLDAVPVARDYVGDVVADGRKVNFDHGALRTIAFGDDQEDDGYLAFDRLLRPLGYQVAGDYPLPRLKMTGRAYAQADDPENVPQFFLSELHVGEFSPEFAEAAHRVFDSRREPLDEAGEAALTKLDTSDSLTLEEAEMLLRQLRAAFGRRHDVPTWADYEALRAESGEAAWIATEGNAFNHATDRVENVDVVAERQRELGRPIKDAVEVSGNGRVRQTAFKAPMVARPFIDAEGKEIEREVPGSFYEFITRDEIEDTGDLDLTFDSGNATGIFAMTRGN